MKRVLVIKMSALGDILHTLPAVSDALRAYPDIQFDWLCEEPLMDVAKLHSSVANVIGHGRLRWKKSRLSLATLKEQFTFYRSLRRNRYDLVIDAQGRVKSARVGWLTGAPVVGLDQHSATDTETRWFYSKGYPVPRDMNAIERVRSLFAQALNYSYSGEPDFGIDHERLDPCLPELSGAWIFLHGTTWASKHWPESQWIELLKIARREQKPVLLPWGSDTEKTRAERMVDAAEWGIVLPKMRLWQLSGLISRCEATVGVDTGLMHIAAACGVPTVSIFGSTSVALTGAMGHLVKNLSSEFECSPCLKKNCPLNEKSPPCYQELSAQRVRDAINQLMINDGK
ncbi:lipopolysaccharide heptosyltransferase I [Thalassolituus sp. LLYu03]|uniref:lipopolysaccharide heptosyltransferase I n=1 Tax=Thalassolituus sp. LLYu03 TaxID=3421656 RepID=UPI003D2AF072